MDRYYCIGCMAYILPQEHMGWEITARCDLCLAMEVQFKGISTIVTGIHYETINGELVRTYELSRRKGYICAPKKNPHIFGMGIPATVKERSGNCVRVHFDIDSKYDTSSNTLYFAYAIESSFIYCMPEVGSRVHVYFPSDDERDAYAVHAIRTSGAGSSGYAQNPDCKSFSNVNGALLLLTPSAALISADEEQKTCLYLGTEGNAFIEGKTVEIRAEKLSLGEPVEEGESPAAAVELEAESLTMQIGEDGAQIKLAQERRLLRHLSA